MNNAESFIAESNRIEGITRPPTKAEIAEFHRFMALARVTVGQLEQFVSVYQPGAKLRSGIGMNVRVGGYVPPRGGPDVLLRLQALLDKVNANEIESFEAHIDYESIHPFMDGNGRSGRMLWAWQMQDIPLGFLHSFYYQTLQNHGGRK